VENIARAVVGLLLSLAVLILTVRPLAVAPATPVAGLACTSVRAPQPLPTPTRPAWAGEEPPVTPEPVPEAVLDPLVPGYLEHAMGRFAACWNAGDWAMVTRGATPRFLRTAFGTPYDPAALARLGLGPVTLLEVSPPRLWSDQRVAIEVRYQRGLQVVTERWFFLVLNGDALLDEAVPLPLPPLGDRVVLGVETANIAGPWAWRGAPPAVVPALPLLVLAVANRTPEPRTIIVHGPDGAVAGYLPVPGGSEVELGLRDLLPGRYEISSAESPEAESLAFQVGEVGE
jgi:hypothetical protein